MLSVEQIRAKAEEAQHLRGLVNLHLKQALNAEREYQNVLQELYPDEQLHSLTNALTGMLRGEDQL